MTIDPSTRVSVPRLRLRRPSLLQPVREQMLERATGDSLWPSSPEPASAKGDIPRLYESMPFLKYLEASLASSMSQLGGDPKNADLRCDIARLYLWLNKPKRAYVHLSRAVQDRPDHQEARYNLAVLYGTGVGVRQHRLLASALVKDLLKEDYAPPVRKDRRKRIGASDSLNSQLINDLKEPKKADYFCEQAKANLENGKPKMAFLSLSQALRGMPDYKEAQYLVALLYGAGIGVDQKLKLADSTVTKLKQAGYPPKGKYFPPAVRRLENWLTAMTIPKEAPVQLRLRKGGSTSLGPILERITRDLERLTLEEEALSPASRKEYREKVHSYRSMMQWLTYQMSRLTLNDASHIPEKP